MILQCCFALLDRLPDVTCRTNARSAGFATCIDQCRLFHGYDTAWTDAQGLQEHAASLITPLRGSWPHTVCTEVWFVFIYISWPYWMWGFRIRVFWYSDICSPTIRRNVLPPSSGWKNKASNRFCLLIVRCLLGSLFDSENGGGIFRNVPKLPDCTASHARR
jgi:hypothetical protein